MKRKILVIDGGGVKGVFPAAFLKNIEENIDGPIYEYFDLIVGTSTGGIIALGLGLGLSADEMLSFYKKYSKSIFGGNIILKIIRNIFHSKYNSDVLKLSLEEIFSNKKLGESHTRLVIPSLNLDTTEVYIYKTAHHKHLSNDYKSKVLDVALATSAAPTFFPTHILPSGTPLVDGGMWANNPIGMAIVEAIGILKWSSSDIKVLSLGCTTKPLDTGGSNSLSLGKLYWATRITELFLHAQNSASMGTAAVLTSHEQIVRIEPIVSPNKYDLDNYKSISSLEGLGENYARKNFPRLKEFFLEKVDPFIPFYKLNK